MKNRIVLSVVTAVVALAGCRTTRAALIGDCSLTIARPVDQVLRRGGVNKVDVTVQRRGFRSDVTMAHDGVPDGVRMIETDRHFTERDIVVSYTLHAEPDAPVIREALVTVKATGPEGLAASEIFHLTVKADETGMK